MKPLRRSRLGEGDLDIKPEAFLRCVVRRAQGFAGSLAEFETKAQTDLCLGVSWHTLGAQIGFGHLNMFLGLFKAWNLRGCSGQQPTGGPEADEGELHRSQGHSLETQQACHFQGWGLFPQLKTDPEWLS